MLSRCRPIVRYASVALFGAWGLIGFTGPIRAQIADNCKVGCLKVNRHCVWHIEA